MGGLPSQANKTILRSHGQQQQRRRLLSLTTTPPTQHKKRAEQRREEEEEEAHQEAKKLMSSTQMPPPPPQERRIPVVPMVPQLADDGGDATGGARGSGSVAGISPSILIIAVIVVVMLLASISIQFFIRHLSRQTVASSGSSSAPPLPLVARPPAPASVAPAADQGKASGEAAAETERLISRLPLFSLASSLAALPKSSRDCAVCQSAFRNNDELRLLPACRHAFHSRCVDPWLRANPSCPLCRSSIALPHPPLPELLRVELGSVSNRLSNSSSTVAAAPPDGSAVRAYPLPSLPNSEYLVEEELQVVLKQPSANPPGAPAPGTGEPSQQQQPLAAVERGHPSSVTRTASFSSARSQERWSNRWSNRWSSRWSSRYDAGSVTEAATAEWWWDMDGGAAPAARRREAEEGSAFYGLLRWLTGAY